jgi:hypothetical protein
MTTKLSFYKDVKNMIMENNKLIAMITIMSQRIATSYSILNNDLTEEIKSDINNSLLNISNELNRLHKLITQSITIKE